MAISSTTLRILLSKGSPVLGEINLPPKASATAEPPEEREAILPKLAKETTITVPTVVMRASSIDQASGRYSSICMRTAENSAKTAMMMQTTAIKK
jgi:hypothetical protein